MQSLRSRHVSSTSKSPDCVVAHQSDRSDAAAPPSLVFCLGFVDQPRNPWFDGELLETTRTRCSLRQSPFMTRTPHSPSSTLVLRFYQETIHDSILLFLPPCGPHLTPLATRSLEPSLLVFSTLEASPAVTFRACSLPAPTLIKPQPAPAILSQESVHTTFSITHHTRKRPSTGP
jgi:hypothetical protein